MLAILFVIFFTVALLSSTLKFGLLNYTFWSTAFEKHDIYSSLSGVIKNSVTTQVGKEGGKGSDVEVLTDLITPENTKDVVNNNLSNLIDFLNGKAKEIIVYVPINKAPKGLLPKNIAELNNEMTLTQLGEKFNIAGLNDLPLNNLNRAGDTILYIFAGSTAALIFLLIMLVVSTKAGLRFWAPGMAFILSGIGTLLLTRVGTNLASSLGNFAGRADLNSVIVATIAPPLLTELIKIWAYGGVALAVVGLILFFIKKPN